MSKRKEMGSGLPQEGNPYHGSSPRPFSLKDRMRSLALWISGGLVLSGLWMFDEILSEVLYCRIEQVGGCGYPIPLLGTFAPYDAEGFAWAMVIGGAAIGIWASGWRRK